MGALALNILACGSLMRPLKSSEGPLPEKTAVENVPERYSIYNEKEKNLEENINILEKCCGSEETYKSTLANGDCKQENLLHKNSTTMAHTKEAETYKKKVAEQTYFANSLPRGSGNCIKTTVEKLWLFLKTKYFQHSSSLSFFLTSEGFHLYYLWKM